MKRETPVKPDFEKMAREWNDEHYMRGYCVPSYIAGMERIWRDYVASKEVEAINSELLKAVEQGVSYLKSGPLMEGERMLLYQFERAIEKVNTRVEKGPNQADFKG